MACEKQATQFAGDINSHPHKERFLSAPGELPTAREPCRDLRVVRDGEFVKTFPATDFLVSSGRARGKGDGSGKHQRGLSRSGEGAGSGGGTGQGKRQRDVGPEVLESRRVGGNDDGMRPQDGVELVEWLKSIGLTSIKSAQVVDCDGRTVSVPRLFEWRWHLASSRRGAIRLTAIFSDEELQKYGDPADKRKKPPVLMSAISELRLSTMDSTAAR